MLIVQFGTNANLSGQSEAAKKYSYVVKELKQVINSPGDTYPGTPVTCRTATVSFRHSLQNVDNFSHLSANLSVERPRSGLEYPPSGTAGVQKNFYSDPVVHIHTEKGTLFRPSSEGPSGQFQVAEFKDSSSDISYCSSYDWNDGESDKESINSSRNGAAYGELDEAEPIDQNTSANNLHQDCTDVNDEKARGVRKMISGFIENTLFALNKMRGRAKKYKVG